MILRLISNTHMAVPWGENISRRPVDFGFNLREFQWAGAEIWPRWAPLTAHWGILTAWEQDASSCLSQYVLVATCRAFICILRSESRTDEAVAPLDCDYRLDTSYKLLGIPLIKKIYSDVVLSPPLKFDPWEGLLWCWVWKQCIIPRPVMVPTLLGSCNILNTSETRDRVYKCVL